MVFASPLWLWALLALPLLIAAEAWLVRHDGERTSLLVARALWARTVRRPSQYVRFARLGFWLLSVTGIVLALARPQWGTIREKLEREGVDVVLVLDTSGSMATEDTAPNRFFLARQALMSLIARLTGDRFALVAFEGEAYTLVPLTLDADIVALFLDTIESGAVPSPGTSLGAGLDRGLDAFVDKEQRFKTMVVVSDGEDLEGEVDTAVRKAKETGVVVHTVGVGTEQGQPVPDFDREGRRSGFKHHPDGSPVISRLNMASLEAIARGTGGHAFHITPADTSLFELASTIESMAQKTMAREFAYRKKERFQWPLALGLAALSLALLLPLPPRRKRARSSASRAVKAAFVVASVLMGARGVSAAEGGGLKDELLMQPTRITRRGRHEYEKGDLPKALSSFQEARRLRPRDARAAFNLGDALYKNGKYDDAAAIFRSLAADTRSKLAFPSRFNLGNSLFQQKDFAGAVRAYRDALRITPGDVETRRNLELALRAIEEQKRQQRQDKRDQNDRKQEQKREQREGGRKKPERPKTEKEKEQERFKKETGMPKERAMQLLDALQQNEKAEQKRLLAEKRAARKGAKDW